MKKILLLVLLLSFCFLNIVWADDVDVNLNSNNGTTGFVIRNNLSTPDSLLKVKSNGDIGLKTGRFINYGTTYGTAGYGFRDSGGVMQYKNSGGTWAPFGYVDNDVTTPYGFGSGTYSYGQISYNHGNYGDTQPLVTVGTQSAYESMLPASLYADTTPTSSNYVNGSDISIISLSSKPAYFYINTTGTYRISASVALKGTTNVSIEVEVFRRNQSTITGIPSRTDWRTGTDDLEALSTALSVTNTSYDSGSVNGIHQLNANDYVALCARLVSGSSTNDHKVICINFNVERIK